MVVQMSAMGHPMLGTKEVHTAAATWSCNGPADPRPVLPRTKVSSLESSAEVPVQSLCILWQCYEWESILLQWPTYCMHTSKTSRVAQHCCWITAATRRIYVWYFKCHEILVFFVAQWNLHLLLLMEMKVDGECGCFPDNQGCLSFQTLCNH